MPQIVRTEREKRGFFGTVFKWLFILFNILMALWLFAGLANVGDVTDKAGSEAERAGTVVGSALGLGIILFVWIAGTVILGMLALVTRGSKRVVVEEVSRLALLLLAGAVFPALAADLPRWDARDQCEGQLRVTGQTGDAWLLNACLEQEQRAYDALKAAWPKLPGEVADTCTGQMSTVGQSSYWLLNACVEQQVQARGEIEGFKFRY